MVLGINIHENGLLNPQSSMICTQFGAACIVGLTCMQVELNWVDHGMHNARIPISILIRILFF